MSEATPLKILVLDGGGVRGLSEVLILKNLFQRIAFEENAGRRSEKLPEPYKYFDLICGTSTGGLLALMLGRLRMVPPFSLPLVRTLSH
jgi:patatin-like phospholipase/acyl hydrolase